MSEEKYKYQIRATTKFKKSAKLAAKRGKDTQKLKDVVEKLAKGEPLDPALRDHSLSGNWGNHREIHIEPNWLLIYRIEENILVLELVTQVRIQTYSRNNQVSALGIPQRG